MSIPTPMPLGSIISICLNAKSLLSRVITVKPPYNYMTYLADYIVILKALLYPIFVYKMHPKYKLTNNIIYT